MNETGMILRDRAFQRWLLLALVVRIVFVLMLDGERYYFSDTRHYDGGARQILETGCLGDNYSRAPLYSYWLAGVYTVTAPSFIAARLVDVLLSTALCLLISAIAWRLFGRTPAVWAVALAAFYPHFILLSGLLYPTLLFTLFLTAAVTALFLLRRTHLRGLVCGVLLALAALTVPAAIFVLPVFVIALVIDRSPVHKRLAALGLFGLVFVATLSPWTLRNYRLYHRLVWIQYVPNTVLPDFNNPDNREQEVMLGFPSTTAYKKQNPRGSSQDRLDRFVWHYAQNPGQTLRHILTEIGHFWALYPDRLNTDDVVYRRSIHERDSRMEMGGDRIWRWIPLISTLVMAPVLIFSLLGWWQIRHRRDSAPWILSAVLVCMTLGYSLITAEVRYRIPVEPCLLVFTACGLQTSRHWLNGLVIKRTRNKRCWNGNGQS